jgi:hypothetical protein
MLFPDDFEHLSALCVLVNQWWTHRHGQSRRASQSRLQQMTRHLVQQVQRA